MNNENLDVLHRGDVYVAYLGATFGCSGMDIRPVVIMENDSGEFNCPTVTIVPLGEWRMDFNRTTHCLLDGEKYPFLRNATIALCDSPNVIGKQRLISYLGQIDFYDVLRLARGLELYFGFDVPETVDAP